MNHEPMGYEELLGTFSDALAAYQDENLDVALDLIAKAATSVREERETRALEAAAVKATNCQCLGGLTAAPGDWQSHPEDGRPCSVAGKAA